MKIEQNESQGLNVQLMLAFHALYAAGEGK